MLEWYAFWSLHHGRVTWELVHLSDGADADVLIDEIIDLYGIWPGPGQANITISYEMMLALFGDYDVRQRPLPRVPEEQRNLEAHRRGWKILARGTDVICARGPGRRLVHYVAPEDLGETDRVLYQHLRHAGLPSGPARDLTVSCLDLTVSEREVMLGLVGDAMDPFEAAQAARLLGV